MKVTVGQVVAMLAKCASNSDEVLMGRPIWDIGVTEEGIDLLFDDANARNYHINLDGSKSQGGE